MTDEQNPALTKESMDKVIKLLDKYMPDDLRFAMDSKNFKIFIQNIPTKEYLDKFTGVKVIASKILPIENNNIELSIAKEMSKDIKSLLSHSDYAAIEKYSFCIWKIEDNKVFFAKSVSTK